MDFYDTNLDDSILDALDAMHYSECTPIQEQAIPPLLEGRDMVGIAQTGTGKTAAYLLPILNRLCTEDFPKESINCLIMAPTRELAQQIDQAVEAFSYFLPISSVSIYGGNDGIRYEQEKRSLRMGADIVIATPGRLISHISLGNVNLSKISIFVLDEADRMLDMGFIDDIMSIIKQLPEKRQTMLFSATMPAEIQKLAHSILNNPVSAKIAITKPAEKIDQKAFICTNQQKNEILKRLFNDKELKRVIIFISKKSKVRELTTILKRQGVKVEGMHSDLEQKDREKVLRAFKVNVVDVLVSTDLLSRGIDVDDIEMVINFDVPRHPEDYVHRIGRTARANRYGKAITLVNEEDQFYFYKIEKAIGHEIEKSPIPAEFGEAPEYQPIKKRNTSPKRSYRRCSQTREKQNIDERPNRRNNRNWKRKKNKNEN